MFVITLTLVRHAKKVAVKKIAIIEDIAIKVNANALLDSKVLFAKKEFAQKTAQEMENALMETVNAKKDI